MDSIDKIILKILAKNAEASATEIGSAFGDGGEGYIRICYASKYEQLQEALARLEAAFGKKSG